MCCESHRTRITTAAVLTTEPRLYARLAHAKALDTTLTLAFTITWAPAPAPATVTTVLPERATVAV